MRLLTTLIFIGGCLMGCGPREKIEGINLNVVKDGGGDTLSRIHVVGDDKYFWYHDGIMEGLASDKAILSRIPGEFVLGLRGRKDSTLRYFMFRTRHATIELVRDKKVMPFLLSELGVDPDSETIVVDNFMDSYNHVDIKLERQAAIDKESRDTLLFQEMMYFSQDSNLFASYIVYRSRATRYEMQTLIDEAAEKAKDAIKN